MISKKTEKGRRCDSFQVVPKFSMIKTIKKVFHKRGDNYHIADKILCAPILTDSDTIFIVNFSKTCLKDLNKTDQLLRSCLVESLDLYKEPKKMKTKNQNQATESLSFPITDSFINKFIAMYKDKSNDDIKNSLVV